MPCLILFLGWLSGAIDGVLSDWDAGLPLIESALTSFALALAVGLMHLVLFLLIAFVSPHHGLRRFLNGYLSPSPVITGFALLLVPWKATFGTF